jgi:hypothetical protein
MRKQLPTERDFSVTGKVSIWIGDFDNEDALLDYVESEQGFGADFGCLLCHSRELAVLPHPRPLRELLQPFSSAKDFVDEIVAISGEKTFSRCAVVAYAADYRLLGFEPNANARLTFVGVASF